MTTARRLIAVAAARPSEALEDVIGLAALTALIFGGFAATALL